MYDTTIMSIWIFALAIAGAVLLGMSFVFYRSRSEHDVLPTTYVIDGHAVPHETFEALRAQLSVAEHPTVPASTEHDMPVQYAARHTTTNEPYLLSEYRTIGGTTTYAITRETAQT